MRGVPLRDHTHNLTDVREVVHGPRRDQLRHRHGPEIGMHAAPFELRAQPELGDVGEISRTPHGEQIEQFFNALSGEGALEAKAVHRHEHGALARVEDQANAHLRSGRLVAVRLGRNGLKREWVAAVTKERNREPWIRDFVHLIASSGPSSGLISLERGAGE